jgi:mannose-6-phosphate isomerase-like protein (cupin superfamily)
MSLEGFAAQLAERPELWRHLVRHEDNARIYEQIWDDEHVNAWVVCWSDGHDTGFHDHDDAGAAIAVVAGSVVEERLRIGGAPQERTISAGETAFVPPTAIHRVRHAGGGPAVTIHAYSPPLRRTGAYRVTSDGVLQRAAQPYETELRPAA